MEQTEIYFGSYAFHDHGAALFGLDREFERSPDSRADAVSYTYTVTIRFFEEDFAAIEAEIAALRTALDSGEAVLLIRDENGTELHNRRVRVVSDSLPAEWRQYRGEVTVKFAGRDISVAATAVDASFTPTGGEAIVLSNIGSWSESISTDRHSTQASDRRESRLNVVATGIIRANPEMAEAARRAFLISEKSRIQAANDTPDGVLTFGGQSRLMQVENLSANLAGDASDRLEWTMTLFRKQFPGSEYAEARFDVRTSTNWETREVTVNVSGTVRADTETEARNKATAIRDHYAASYALLSSDIGQAYTSGADTDSAGQLPGTFLEMPFTFQYRDTEADILNWEWRVDTRIDTRTGLQTITYSGRVLGTGATAALAKARALGDNKYPFKVSSSEQLAYRKMGNESEKFVDCTFSYEYQTRDAVIFAEVTAETKVDRYGSCTYAVSGYVSAQSAATAQSTGRAFKDGTRLVLSETESTVTEYCNGSDQFQRFNFNYSYLTAAGATTIEYGRTEAYQYEQAEKTVTYDGMARGGSESVCRALVNSVTAAPSGGTLMSAVYTPAYKKEGSKSVLEGYRFTVSYSVALGAGDLPGTIIEAEYTLACTYSVDHAVITPVVYGTPVVQTKVGTTPGAARVTGTVVGFSAAAVKSWGRSKESALPSGGHDEPAQDSLTIVSRRFSPNTDQLYRFTFTYSAIYTELNPS